MVKAVKETALAEYAARPAESTSSVVRVSEIVGEQQMRLEATAYGVEMRRAVAAVRGCQFGTVMLFGVEGLCREAPKPIRLRRIFVDASHGVGFLSSSDIIAIRPDPTQFVSRKLTRNLDEIRIRVNDVLISRSGTVGNVALAGKRIAGSAVSEHVIRLGAPDAETAGFVAAFLRSKYGRPQLTQSAYGSVVQHIEPAHLAHVVAPNVPPVRRLAIGNRMCEATDKRDLANSRLDEADAALKAELGLPPVAQLSRLDRSRPRVRLRQLEERFDVRYHDPAAKALIARLNKSAFAVVPLGAPEVAEVFAVTKFRKRVYVREGGLPLLPSKQIFQVDPVEIKGLARGAHLKDLPEIQLAERMILVTCSGTIGRVHMVPKYMASWTASQDALRVTASKAEQAGYLYAWLASEYGQLLLQREAYGSVIIHIDREMLAGIPVPMVSRPAMRRISNLVHEATELRDDAWELERAAIRQIEELIEDNAL